jgi:hypothetical protein
VSNARVLRRCQSIFTFDGVESCGLQILSHQMKQPVAIRILRWFAALASAGMFVSIALAILDIGPHFMGGERVTRSEWLHIAAPLVAVIGCLMASIAYGLAAGKAWPRHLVMAIFVLIIVYATALGAVNVLRHTIMWRAIVNASLFGCASAWYFYFKPNVAEYFRKLGAR